MYQFDATISSAVRAEGVPPPAARMPDTRPLSADLLDRMQRYWQAANYLTIGQIYLQDNPLLRETLRADQIKPRLLGHWGTSVHFVEGGDPLSRRSSLTPSSSPCSTCGCAATVQTNYSMRTVDLSPN